MIELYEFGYLTKYLSPILLSAFVSYLVLINKRRHRLPPGPIGIPILGYIPFLGDYSFKQLWKLSKVYGDVFMIKLGPHNAVIINDHMSAAEAFSKDSFSNRPEHTIFNIFGADKGLTNWSNTIWKEHRRFVLRTLRNIRVGTFEFENVINDEIDYMFHKIDSTEEETVPVRRFLGPSASNIVLSVLMGKRFDYENPTRNMLDDVLSFEELGTLPFTGFISSFAWFAKIGRFLPFTRGPIVMERTRLFNKFFDDEIDYHIKNYSAANQLNVIDCYLRECETSQSNHFSKSNIQGLCGDMLGAGSGTVKDSVEYLLLNIALNDEYQRMIHSEIDEAIGSERRPSFADRVKMPFTQAAINESLRHGSLIPLNLPHIASEDSMIGKYFIPKGTHVYVNNWAINHDPNYWANPSRFDPTRFLNSDRKLIKHAAFMPFGFGKRSCPGESLAHVELFLFIANILQKYRIELLCDKVLSTETKLEGFTLVPKVPIDLKFTKK